jgi:hypothetical protein
MMKPRWKLLVVNAILGLAVALPAWAGSFSDSFEGSSFNPYWTITQQYGTVTLSTAEAHSGSQSAAFSSTYGGQREMLLTHTYTSENQGDVSVWFYDAAPGQETLYEKLYAYDTVSGWIADIGTQDFDAYCYAVDFYNPGLGLSEGPNANCGIYPQLSTTDVSRTLGWHQLAIDYGPGGTSFLIDGNTVFTAPGSYTFDAVELDVSGPDWRPNTTAYFDDFNVTTGAVPEPSTFILLLGGLAGLGLKRKKSSG